LLFFSTVISDCSVQKNISWSGLESGVRAALSVVSAVRSKQCYAANPTTYTLLLHRILKFRHSKNALISQQEAQELQ